MKTIGYVVILLCLFVQPLCAGDRVPLLAADGHPLIGTLSRPTGSNDLGKGVVLLPMYGQTKESWHPLVSRLNRAGFTTLALDLRGHGESRLTADGRDDGLRVQRRDSTLFNAMDLDAAAAVTWLSQSMQVHAENIALVGASVGCSVALKAVSNGQVRAGAVVVMTPGSGYLGVPTMDHITTWPGTPLLILSSEEEKERGAVQIYAVLSQKGAELQLFSETSIHGTNMFGRVRDVDNLIIDWLRKKL